MELSSPRMRVSSPSLEVCKQKPRANSSNRGTCVRGLALAALEACDSVTLLTDYDRFSYCNQVLRKWAHEDCVPSQTQHFICLVPLHSAISSQGSVDRTQGSMNLLREYITSVIH